ncbi:MAG: GNAT family N-acetyltransferase [Thermomicrobiales bacterium]
MTDADVPVTIGDFDPDDEGARAQAADLLLAAFPQWTATRAEAEAEVAEALQPDHICLAVRQGEQLLGWVAALPAYSHAWELHPLVVREDVRGIGIGRALVTELEERVRQRGVLTLYLGTDDEGETAGTSVWGIDLFPDPLAHAARLQSIDHAAGFYQRTRYAVIGIIPDANMVRGSRIS